MKAANRTLVTAIVAAALLAVSPLASAAKGGRGKPPPPPSYPPARAWHSFTDNGSTAPETSRLYLYGGGGSDGILLSDFWYFSVGDTQWTLAPTGRSSPGAHQHAGLSCGAGRCVLANGSNGGRSLEDTWVYTEDSATWSQLNCKRVLCTSARQMPTMAFDSARFHFVLFGGESNTGATLGDTYTFSGTTGRWTLQNPPTSPSPRRSAATAFVAGPVNRVVLFGGQVHESEVLCDIWSWTGSTWEEVEQLNWTEGPCLHSHSMAWDGARLIVTGGYVDTSDAPNDAVWAFTFTPDGQAGNWTYYPDLYTHFDCAGDIHPGARMAYDRPSGTMVFFGGEETVNGLGLVRYDDTAVCQ